MADERKKRIQEAWETFQNKMTTLKLRRSQALRDFRLRVAKKKSTALKERMS